MKLNERTTAVFWHRVDIRFETVAWCLSLLKFKTIRINELCNYTVFNNQIKVESRRNEREEWSYLKISPIESVNWRTVYVQKFWGLCFSSCVPVLQFKCSRVLIQIFMLWLNFIHQFFFFYDWNRLVLFLTFESLVSQKIKKITRNNKKRLFLVGKNQT